MKRSAHERHNLIGVLSVPILLISTLTGAAFVFDDTVRHAVYAVLRTPPDPTRPVVKIGEKRLPIDRLVRSAEAVVPEARIRSVVWPTKANQPVSVGKVIPGGGLWNSVTVAVDPYTGRVVGVDDERDSPSGRRLMSALSPLHFGDWGGLASKILYGLVGLAPLGLFVTGIAQYVFLRRAKRSNRRRVLDDAHETVGVS